VYAYQEPTVEIKAKNALSKAEFAGLIGFPKLEEIEIAKTNDATVRTAWNYAMMFDHVVTDAEITLHLLALLGTKGLFSQSDIEKLTVGQPIW